jgi:peroxiredoxin
MSRTVWLGLVLGLSLLGKPLPAGADGNAVAVGQPAPPFMATDLQGNTVRLQEYRGHPMMLNFWATWCVPCREEMPVLQAAYATHQENGLVILAINQDDKNSQDVVRMYVDRAEVSFRTILDPDGQVATLYKVFLLPSTVFVNAAGTITAIHIGATTQAQLERYLAVTLSQ